MKKANLEISIEKHWKMKFLIVCFFICIANAIANKEQTDTLKKEIKIQQTILDEQHLNEELPTLDRNASQKLLFIVYRHGERSLAIKFPNDDNAFNSTLWPDGDGQLTIPGKLRMYNLGVNLKERYANFVTQDVRELHVRSSGLDRCIESAQLVAFAMYPPRARWLWHENVTQFQPIPITSTIPNTDPMINPHAACKNGWAERARIYNSEYAQNLNRNNRDLYSFLTKHVGLKVENIDNVKAVFDVLTVEQSMNYTLPNWTSPIILSKLEKLDDLSFYMEFMTRKAQMFRTGVFINELQEQILNRITLKPKEPKKLIKFEWDPNDFEHYKVFQYSTHDSFISALLIALGNFDYKHPPYAATILFEIYQNDLDNLTKRATNLAKKTKIAIENTFIKIFYLKHTETKNPIRLTLSNCKHQEYCSFSEFFKYTEDIIITKEDWYKKCEE